jgi:hypothetical protein
MTALQQERPTSMPQEKQRWSSVPTGTLAPWPRFPAVDEATQAARAFGCATADCH